MQGISHNNLMIPAVSCQPKPQSHVSTSDCLAWEPSSNITNLLLVSLGLLCEPFELLPITTNVRPGGTTQVPALLWWTFSICIFHQIVLNSCRRHYRCCYHCLGWCATLHRCCAWTIPSNVPHHMACIAFLSIPPNGAATCMVLNFRTATIALAIATMGLPPLLSLPSFIARCPCLSLCQQFCCMVSGVLCSESPYCVRPSLCRVRHHVAMG